MYAIGDYLRIKPVGPLVDEVHNRVVRIWRVGEDPGGTLVYWATSPLNQDSAEFYLYAHECDPATEDEYLIDRLLG